jgi:acetyl-CoA C-acetyltransferase
MKAVMLAHDLLLAGSANIIVAGGMESMSNAPIFSIARAPAIAWATAACSITCFSTALKTPTIKAA